MHKNKYRLNNFKAVCGVVVYDYLNLAFSCARLRSFLRSKLFLSCHVFAIFTPILWGQDLNLLSGLEASWRSIMTLFLLFVLSFFIGSCCRAVCEVAIRSGRQKKYHHSCLMNFQHTYIINRDGTWNFLPTYYSETISEFQNLSLIQTELFFR